ncbi:MAG: alkaline phosphatase family protein [Methanotrichaceae archaeon]
MAGSKLRSVRLVDVAPTMAYVLGQRMPMIDGRPIAEVKDWVCERVVLLIVDSLGYNLYRTLEPFLPHMRVLARNGLLLKAESVANSTTPSIASMLTGLLPQNHRVYNTKEASESDIISILELASSQKIRTAVVMEETGAKTFENFVDVMYGVPRTLNALEFDRQICVRSLEALAADPKMLVTYFIGIDKIAHQGGGMNYIRAIAMAIDDHLGSIIGASPCRTLIIVCGDHPIHAGKLKDVLDTNHVALILGNKSTTLD